MGAYYTWTDRIECVLIVFGAYAGAYLIYTLIMCAVQRRERLKWQRERRRLEKIVNDYNKAYKDDYDPFER